MNRTFPCTQNRFLCMFTRANSRALMCVCVCFCWFRQFWIWISWWWPLNQMTGFLCNCVRCNVNEEKWRQQQQKPQCMYLRPEWQVSVSSNMRRCLLIVFLSLEKCDRRLGTQESTNYVCSLDKHMCVCVCACEWLFGFSQKSIEHRRAAFCQWTIC